MHRFLSVLLAVSFLLAPRTVPATPRHSVTTNSSQRELDQHPLACERVRIVLRNGKRLDADYYRHQEDHVEITWKGKSQTIRDNDILRVDVSQGSCLDAAVTRKSGEKVVGYWRGETCDANRNCSAEVSQKSKVLSIPVSDIQDLDIKYKRTFRDKIRNIAFILLYPVYALLVVVHCRHGCD